MFIDIKEERDHFIIDIDTRSKNSLKMALVIVCLLLTAGISSYAFYSNNRSISGSEAAQGIQDTGLPKLSEDDKSIIISTAYQAVDDHFENKDTPLEWPEELDDIDNRVFVRFRIDRAEKGSWSSSGTENLAQTTYLATQNTLNDTRFGGNLQEQDIPKLKIEIFIIGAEFTSYDNYEHGIHGVRIQNGDNGAYFYNAVAIEHNYTPEELFESLCKKAGLEENCRTDPQTQVYFFPTVHFGTTEFTQDITTYYRCNPLFDSDDLTHEALQESIILAEKWTLRNINEDGIFNYKYYPSTNTYSTDNNAIRQLLSSRELSILSSRDPSLEPAHRKNLEYILDTWYYENDGSGYVTLSYYVKLGANALAIRAIAASPLFEEYEGYARKLADAIIDEQDPSGGLVAYLDYSGGDYDGDHLLLYYSGEAILALTELYERTNDDKYLTSAVRAQDYFYEKYVNQIDTYYNPRYVPWHTMSMAKLYKITDKKEYADGIFIMNDKLLEMQHTSDLPFPDYQGRFYDENHPEYGPPHSGSSGIYLEGVSNAYEIAEIVEDQAHKEKYRNAIILSVSNLINLQYRGANMYYLEYPEKAEGGFRASLTRNYLQIDSTQHTLDAFNKINELGIVD